MSISVNANGNVNWAALLSGVGDVQSTTNAEGKESLTITVKGDDGAEKVLNIEVPTLEAPENVDAAKIDTLVAKLKENIFSMNEAEIETLKDELVKALNATSEALGKVSSSSKGSVMFDIYALMTLLVEVAQKQRDATREIRKSQNEMVQKAIQDQADQQRAAAWNGLLLGVICGAVSVVSSLAIMAAQTKTFNQQRNISSNAGLEAGANKLQAMQNTDTVAHAETALDRVQVSVGAEVADRVKSDFSNQLVDDQAGNLATNFDNARTELATAKSNVETKNAELATAEQTLATKTTAKDTAQANLDTAKNNYNAPEDLTKAYNDAVAERDNQVRLFGNQDKDALAPFEMKVAEAKAALDNAKVEALKPYETALANAEKDLATARADVNTKQNAVDLANQAEAKAQVNFDKAKADYAKTIQDVGDQYGEKYKTAVERRANPPKDADIAALDNDVKTAKAEMQMARAYEAKLLAADDVLTPSEQKDLVRAARVESETASHNVMNRADYKSLDHRMGVLVGLNNMTQAIFNTASGAIQNYTAMKQAEATALGAEHQRQQELLEETKDLFEQDQKLIDSVVQLMQAVTQAETQSMRDAIQA